LKLLLQDSRVDVNVTGNNGLTALHIASHYQQLDVLLLLLQNNANVHAVAKVTVVMVTHMEIEMGKYRSWFDLSRVIESHRLTTRRFDLKEPEVM